MLFCHSCGNLLLLEQGAELQQFYCQACPFIYPISRTFVSRLELKQKQVDDILGGAEAWKNVDSTNVACPRCEHPRAYFMQIQIRSADEPSSIFYKCCQPTCGHQWREG